MIEIIRTLSTEQKIGQLFIIGLGGPEIDDDTNELLDEISPGGICLFARNIRGLRQTRDLTDDLRNRLPIEPLLALDQEGGLVDRLRRVLSPMPAVDLIRTATDARWLARVVSDALLALGLNMDFAPVVDVIDLDRRGRQNGLTSRTFGSTKEETTELAGEFLKVLQSRGILGCLKHFPGLGSSTVDSHDELPVVDLTDEELFTIDLYPYKTLISLNEVHAVMVGHAAFPATSLQESDQNGRLLPSSMSFNFISGLLRGQLRYDGLVVTDDLEMGAIVRNYGIGEACVKAVLAGADMLAICADAVAIREGYSAVLGASNAGRIAPHRLDESLQRIAKIKQKCSVPTQFDLKRLEDLSGEIKSYSANAART